jgi:hypothetical protein
MSKDKAAISRRRFLLGAAAASAAGFGLYAARDQIRARIWPELDTTYPVGTLADLQMRTILALANAVVAPDSVPPPEFFQDQINWVTQTQRGYLKEYERAVAFLDVTSAGLFAQGRQSYFVDLPHSHRDTVLKTLLWPYSARDRVVRKLEKLGASRDALALRIYVMAPLIEYYYRSSYGWAVVGYESFPGRPPSDPRAYTKSPASTEAIP